MSSGTIQAGGGQYVELIRRGERVLHAETSVG